MKKNSMLLTLLLVIGAVVVLGIGYSVYAGKQQTEVAAVPKASPEPVMNTAEAAGRAESQQAETESQVNGAMSVPEGALAYILSQAEAKYSVMKTYFGKPAVEVVGTTQLVSGNGWFDEEKGTGEVVVNLKFTDVKTDSPKRDQDIAPLFSTPDVVLKGNFTDLPPFSAQAVKITAPVSLTINGVTKEVPMALSITKTANGSLQAEGTGVIKMSDFGIKAPSLVNVFSAADDVNLAFTMQADPNETAQE